MANNPTSAGAAHNPMPLFEGAANMATSITDSSLDPELLQKIEERTVQFDPNAEFHYQSNLLQTSEGVCVLARQGINEFVGYTGAGKSTMLQMLMRLLVYNEDNDKFSTPEFVVCEGYSRPRSNEIYYIDTEQSPVDLRAQIHRFYNLLPKHKYEEVQSRVKFISMNEEPITENADGAPLSGIEKIVRRIVEEVQPLAIFIDHIGDLTLNAQDTAEAQKPILNLLKAANRTGTAVVLSIHSTKSNKSEGNGFLGTFAYQKATVSWLQDSTRPGVWQQRKTRNAATGKELYIYHYNGGVEITNNESEFFERAPRPKQAPETVREYAEYCEEFKTIRAIVEAAAKDGKKWSPKNVDQNIRNNKLWFEIGPKVGAAYTYRFKPNKPENND